MNKNDNKDQIKEAALSKIESINAVEGFDPASLAVEITNMNDGAVRYRLPVMVQMAWFRMKYPEGRIAVTVKPAKDYFLAEARVYVSYKDPADCYLAEGSASRGYSKDKPTISPREWAQTAAIGIALRNAGFGLQFAVAGESYEDNTINEFAEMNSGEKPSTTSEQSHSENTDDTTSVESRKDEKEQQSPNQSANQQQSLLSEKTPELTPLEKAMAMCCPIKKYNDKTLGDMIRIDPTALTYIAKSNGKYSTEVVNGAKLICENAVQQTIA